MRAESQGKKSQTPKVKLLLFLLSMIFMTLITGSALTAIAVLSMIFVHECGHLLAAQNRGIKTRGIYFIPGLGGVALVDEMGSRSDECFISLFGPVYGLAFSLLVLLGYRLTGNFKFAEIAGLLALVNLFNLLPFNPLDGGRIAKSLAFSMHKKVGLVVMSMMVGLSIYLAFRWGLYILLLVAFFCFLDLREEAKKKEEEIDLTDEVREKCPEIDLPPNARVIGRTKYEREKMGVGSIIGYSFATLALIVALILTASPYLDKVVGEFEAEKAKEELVASSENNGGNDGRKQQSDRRGEEAP
jgi:Zn-dependent protease